jgi:peptidoglycan/LPS O-acetylase OafA/YrhL
MRGLAEFSVLIFHFQVIGVLAPVDHLAVDFFFLPSGSVISKIPPFIIFIVSCYFAEQIS